LIRKVIVRDIEKIPPETHRQGKLWNLLPPEMDKKASAALLELEKPNRPQFTKKAVRYYFVIRGSGKIVADSETYHIKEGTIVRVEPLIKHQLIPVEKATILVLSVPAFSEEDTVFCS
jgi:mannose-6-phosphate isomerase-like protein (cupin superfamily)